MKTKRILPIIIVMLAILLPYILYTMRPVVEEPTANEETPANETPGNEGTNVNIVIEPTIEEPPVEEPPIEEPPAEEPTVEPTVEEPPVTEEIIIFHVHDVDDRIPDKVYEIKYKDLFHVPEYPLGTVLGLVASLAAVGVVLKKQ